MATIRAAWKRTVRVREYESETLELMVERDFEEVDGGVSGVAAAVMLDRDLAAAGDKLVAERLEDRVEGRQGVVPKTEQRVFPKSTVNPAKTPGPQAPEKDPFVS